MKSPEESWKNFSRISVRLHFDLIADFSRGGQQLASTSSSSVAIMEAEIHSTIDSPLLKLLSRTNKNMPKIVKKAVNIITVLLL
jgi:hypothetical protein